MKVLASGRCFAFLCISVAVFLLSGCGGGGGSSSSTQSSTPGNTSASFHFSSSSLDFGSVNVGASKSLSITMSNTGTAGVTVTQLSPNDAEFSVTGVSLPLTLNPGQTANGTIAFVPSASKSINATLTAMSSAGSVGTLALAGTGTVTSGGHVVNLSWMASSSSNVVGYNIYRSTASAGPYAKIGSVAGTSFTDSSVQMGQTYYYTVTAVDNTSAESAVAGPVTAVIPAS